MCLRESPWSHARAHRAEAFRGDDEVVTPSLEPAPEDLLGAADGAEVAADGVDVGRVEEGDAAGRGPIENRDGGRLVALQAEGHGSRTEIRDPQPRFAKTICPQHGLPSQPS